jgi:RNA polymerase sigma-70 factor (ECF subfamily)
LAEKNSRSREVFESLALPHLDALYRLALKLTGDRSQAEDVVQDTFLKALRAFGSLRDTSRTRPWLFQILSRLISDRHRTAGREMPLPDEESLDHFSLYERIAEEDPFPYSDDLHGDFLAQFRDEDVRRALLDLPETYRLPLVLVYVEEMTYRELAEVLDCPIGTVMSRLHRGRKALEHALWECAKRRGIIKETPR